MCVYFFLHACAYVRQFKDVTIIIHKIYTCIQFMKSPEYTVPVMDFIDENCMVFDAEEVHLFRFRCHSRSRARLLTHHVIDTQQGNVIAGKLDNGCLLPLQRKPWHQSINL